MHIWRAQGGLWNLPMRVSLAMLCFTTVPPSGPKFIFFESEISRECLCSPKRKRERGIERKEKNKTKQNGPWPFHNPFFIFPFHRDLGYGGTCIYLVCFWTSVSHVGSSFLNTRLLGHSWTLIFIKCKDLYSEERIPHLKSPTDHLNEISFRKNFWVLIVYKQN